MSVHEEILAALRATAGKEGPLLDPRTGRTWQQNLQKALGGQVVENTAYPGARAYQLDCLVPAPDGQLWRSNLRVLLSGAGPYATHTFIQQASVARWWSGPIRTSRSGFTPEDTEALTKLRAWYQANQLTVVDPEVQALPLPDDIPLRQPREGGLTLFGALFRAG